LRSLAYAGGKDFVEQIIPILDDNDKFNRVAAADMLAMIGDSSTVEKVEKVLEARRQGLTEDQIERDWSFKHGYSAITALKTKESTQPIAQSPHSDSLRPIKTAMPLPAVAEIRPPLPIVPIGIIFLAIVGILAYLILRKR
jgi:hypothetical protein